MPEIVTHVGVRELTKEEQAHGREVRLVAGAIPGCYGLVRKLVRGLGEGAVSYQRAQWLLRMSPTLQELMEVEIHKRLDEADEVIARAITGPSEGVPGVTEQQLKTAKWYLEKFGRSRGYTDGKNAKAIQIGGDGGTFNFQLNFVASDDPDKNMLQPVTPGRPKRTGHGPTPDITIIEETVVKEPPPLPKGAPPLT